MLQNSRNAREKPLYFVCDEQLSPYFGHLSGLKKRLPKKKIEGIEYFTLATTNRDYEGWRGEERADPVDGESKGKITRHADPICGGYKLHYIMAVGPRYEAGTTSSSKIFGTMLLLIFLCDGHLRYGNSCAVTDSAYSFVEAMAFLCLWGINWISSLSLTQRRGFLRVTEIQEAEKELEKKKKKENKKKSSKVSQNPSLEKRKFSNEVKAWEKLHKDAKKGSSWW